MSQNQEDKGKFSDLMKKIVSVGVGAGFMTEDSIKNILHDLPLPKDIISGLVQNAKGAKDEFKESVKEEIKNYLSKIELEKIVHSVLENYDVEIEAKFHFKKKPQLSRSKNSSMKESKESKEST